MGSVLSKENSCQSSDISSTQVDIKKKESDSLLKDALTKNESSSFDEDKKEIETKYLVTTDNRTKDISTALPSSTSEKVSKVSEVEEMEFLIDETEASDSEIEFEELSNPETIQVQSVQEAGSSTFQNTEIKSDLSTITDKVDKDSVYLSRNEEESDSDLEASSMLKEIAHLSVMQNVMKSFPSNEADITVLSEDLAEPETATATIVSNRAQKNKYISVISEYKIKIESISEKLQLSSEKEIPEKEISSNSLNDIGEVVDLSTVNLIPGILDLTGDCDSEEFIDLTDLFESEDKCLTTKVAASISEKTQKKNSPVKKISQTESDNIILPSTATLKNVLAQLPSVQSLITKPVNTDKEIETDILNSIKELINGTDESELGSLSVLLPELNKFNSSQEIDASTVEIIDVSIETTKKTSSIPSRPSLLPSNVWDDLELLTTYPASKVGSIKLRRLPGDSLSEPNVIDNPVLKALLLNSHKEMIEPPAEPSPPLPKIPRVKYTKPKIDNCQNNSTISKPDVSPVSVPTEAQNPLILMNSFLQNIPEYLRNESQSLYLNQFPKKENYEKVLPAVTSSQIQTAGIWSPSASKNIIRPNILVEQNSNPKVKKNTTDKKVLPTMNSSSSIQQLSAPAIRRDLFHPEDLTPLNKIVSVEQQSSEKIKKVLPVVKLSLISTSISFPQSPTITTTLKIDNKSITEKALPAVLVSPTQQRSMPIIDEIFTLPSTSSAIKQVITSTLEMVKIEQEKIPLRPWITLNNFKTEASAANMLKNENIFSSLYKCMEFNCSLISDDCNEFLDHVKQHERAAEEKFSTGEQTVDTDSWLCCSYCEYIGDSCNLLLKHIDMAHSSSIYNCCDCFYRSSVAYNVQTHYKQYHPEKEVLINVGSTAQLQMNNEINDMIDSRKKFVLGIYYEEGWFFFFNFNNFVILILIFFRW